MSLILDALRKSEAERRRGQAPDLFASPPAIAAAPHPQWLRYWPAGVLAAVLVVGAVFVFGRAPTLLAEDSAAAPSAATTPMSASAQTTYPTAPASAVPAPAIVAESAPPAAIAATATPTLQTPVSPANVNAGRPQPAAPLPLPAPSMPPSPVDPVAVAAPAPVATPDPQVSDPLPPIAVLAASERASLPPLKLTMHVWASEPVKRFAIIDGNRVGEGASVGNSVVEEIRRDGVVLNIDGRRVLLPRP